LYDYGARWYDAALGRWGAVDPLAERYYNYSGFSYVVNSPINGIDPDGKDVYFIVHTVEFSVYSHGGADGLGGDEATSAYSLSDFTGFSLDKKQLLPEGWDRINFNFDPDRNIACFYGCQESDFALKFLTLSNSLFSGGFGGRSGDSEKPDKFVSNWVSWDNEAIYYLDGFGDLQASLS
jgi:hypothetical protein